MKMRMWMTGGLVAVVTASGALLTGGGTTDDFAERKAQAIGRGDEVVEEAVQRAQTLRRLQAPGGPVGVCCDGKPAYPDSKNTPDGQAGSGEGATSYRSGGREQRPVPGADTKLFGTSFGGWEPSMGVAKDGTLFYAARNSNVDANLIRSRDGGVTWQYVGPATHKVSLDPFMWLDYDTGTVFDSDIDTVTCVPISRSDDQGASWTTTRGCGVTDHQSITGGPVPEGGEPTTGGYPNVVYYCAITGGALAGTSTETGCIRSNDGGRVWKVTGDPAFPPRKDPRSTSPTAFCDGGAGHAAVGQDGTLFVPRGWCGEPYVAISKDEGTTWKRVRVPGPNLIRSAHEAGVGADDDGNVYFSWVGEDRRAYMAVSRDNGDTWGQPVDVTPPGVTAVSDVTAEMAVGKPGAVAMVFLGTEAPADKPAAERGWNAYVVQTTDALATDPRFIAAVQNDPQTNPLWIGTCGTLRCGNIGDFLDVVIGPDGTAWSALVDSCVGKDNKCTGFDVHLPRGEAVVGHVVGAPSLGEPAEADPRRPRRPQHPGAS
jgi:hypothetical protein